MLKSLSILLLMLLSIATCRFLTEEDVCKSEEKRWADCFDEWWKNAGRLSEFQQCLTPGARARYPVGVAYNEKVVECIGDLLEHTECSAEDKKKIMSTAYSNRDNLEMVSIVKKDKEYAENFDKDFDATKYL